jgi:hypothetical protein
VAVVANLRVLIAGTVMAACLAGPAYAQHRPGPNIPTAPEDVQKRRDAEAVDRQYKATLQRTKKDAAAPVDPWQNLRGADDSKTKR